MSRIIFFCIGAVLSGYNEKLFVTNKSSWIDHYNKILLESVLRYAVNLLKPVKAVEAVTQYYRNTAIPQYRNTVRP